MQFNKPFGYLEPNTFWHIDEKFITRQEATKLGMVPLSCACKRQELWIIRNMQQDCIRLKINYCFVKENYPNIVSLWKATHTKQYA